MGVKWLIMNFTYFDRRKKKKQTKRHSFVEVFMFFRSTLGIKYAEVGKDVITGCKLQLTRHHERSIRLLRHGASCTSTDQMSYASAVNQ